MKTRLKAMRASEALLERALALGDAHDFGGTAAGHIDLGLQRLREEINREVGISESASPTGMRVLGPTRRT